VSSFAFAVSQNKNDTFCFFFILNDCVLMVLRKGRLKVYICRFIRIKCFRRPHKKGRLKPHILSKCRNPVIKKNKKHLPALFLGV